MTRQPLSFLALLALCLTKSREQCDNARVSRRRRDSGLPPSSMRAEWSAYSPAQIIEIVREENVRFIRLQFTDIFGSFKNIAITASQLEKALDNKCMFDGSSIEGFVRIEESDMYLYPDRDTFLIFPWSGEEGKTARLICDVYKPDGEPFEGDPRGLLQRRARM